MPSSDMYCWAKEIEWTLRTGTFLWETSWKMNLGESEMSDSMLTPSPKIAAVYLKSSEPFSAKTSPSTWLKSAASKTTVTGRLSRRPSEAWRKPEALTWAVTVASEVERRDRPSMLLSATMGTLTIFTYVCERL